MCWQRRGGWATRELLLGISLALGAVRAFQMPVQQALTPLLVPTQVLPRALAFSSAGMQGAIIAGPALGGATALLPMFARDILQTGPWGPGLLRAAPAVGALVAALWLRLFPGLAQRDELVQGGDYRRP